MSRFNPTTLLAAAALLIASPTANAQQRVTVAPTQMPFAVEVQPEIVFRTPRVRQEQRPQVVRPRIYVDAQHYYRQPLVPIPAPAIAPPYNYDYYRQPQVAAPAYPPPPVYSPPVQVWERERPHAPAPYYPPQEGESFANQQVDPRLTREETCPRGTKAVPGIGCVRTIGAAESWAAMPGIPANDKNCVGKKPGDTYDIVLPDGGVQNRTCATRAQVEAHRPR